MFGIPLKEMGTAAAERIAKDGLLKTIGKGTAKGLAVEPPGELFQQMKEREQAGLPLTDASAMKEYYDNVSPNYTLDYNNIEEKTGYDAAKFLVALFHNTNEARFNMSRSDRKANKFVFPIVYVHSANPIGSANIMGYLNNFYMNEGQAQTCVRVRIPHV